MKGCSRNADICKMLERKGVVADQIKIKSPGPRVAKKQKGVHASFTPKKSHPKLRPMFLDPLFGTTM
jgi:hypothetical protein